jgi:hypothetical protein
MDPISDYLAGEGGGVHEFEARFPRTTRDSYHHILRALAGAGFAVVSDEKLLRISFANGARAEVHDLTAIKAYCARESPKYVTSYIRKDKRTVTENKYGIKLAYCVEVPLSKEEVAALEADWFNQTKKFRFMHRVRLASPTHPDFAVDCSIIKMSVRTSKLFSTSDTMAQPDTCEVEVEAVKKPAKDVFRASLGKICTLVLGGIQRTQFPIGVDQMADALDQYSKLTKTTAVNPLPKRFIGPNSVALQVHNLVAKARPAVASEEELFHADNPYTVQTNYAVTDKADGLRKLLFVDGAGKVYFLTTKLGVEFTNTVCPELKNTLLDGEYIEYGKDNKRLNLYAAFDVYYEGGHDVRGRAFMSDQKTDRYTVLDRITRQLKFTTRKTFYTGDIFEACKRCLEAEYPYTTDGLVFTPMDSPVGGKPPDRLTTWDMSFKWKPQNTIDFQVFVKSETPEYTTLKLCITGSSTNWDNPFDTVLEQEGTYPRATEGLREFITEEDETSYLCNVRMVDGTMPTVEGDIIQSGMVVEFAYTFEKEAYWRWIPLRVRWDKERPNHFTTAHNTWAAIQSPITPEMITGKAPLVDPRYYVGDKTSMAKLRKYHNFVKANLIEQCAKPGYNLIDFSVGKAGDLHKWKAAKLAFVFGIDLSQDNIVNKKDGACMRYLETTSHQSNLYCIFIVGDTTKNIRSGQAGTRSVDALVAKAILGEMPKERVPQNYRNVVRHWGTPFHISAAMFSIHYMFKDKQALMNFVKNVVECTRVRGHFVGTTWDGAVVFKELADTATLRVGNVHVVKQYAETEFRGDESSLGYAVDVSSTFNESREYLVHFDYLEAVLTAHGFRLVESKSFREYDHARFSLDEVSQRLSFWNRSFVFEKTHDVAVDMQFTVARRGSTIIA